ncbi:HU family DNA-binding protein [Blochmannia endosymbiont of Polyrhachis (Hedomyrma) turneri]|uniref:HU family DNA-binding protein n=1 Tax=Blochmannia endosymbiont of Polyrhachis (Hedomyrma) turneri TaxID=1505596 RepID=UPI00061A69F4|nr:HU family DNA-binding protein [Blochmannia endosymbiont of Polyrhachis (Hedomyrma) turneri]AKC59839.1 DNA-binding protein HU-beta [Blochmannia endosymbiont of Polyrhachis (Hedomyrma) turneri]
MNKSQLINKISVDSCISKVAASRALNAMTASVIESLKNGDHVSLIGFGTFIVRIRTPRVVKNPQTGEKIFVKETKIPAFRAGRKLKNAVN